MEYLAALPNIAIYAIVGAACGGVGVLAGIPLTHKGVKSGLILIACVCSPQITKYLVLPQVNVYRTVTEMNKTMPKQIDNVTTLNSVSYSNGSFFYHFAIDDSVPADADINEVKTSGLVGMCNTWRSSFSSKELSSVVYEYTIHGSKRSFSITPSDCN
ncbi:hypothetical protein [Phyllobacterium sp. 22552]|uniref:hypothetical protein n=1 Tax=Phyllobacterium sp. 22552 TaxID=3453941 RepID=UPI003F877709